MSALPEMAQSISIAISLKLVAPTRSPQRGGQDIGDFLASHIEPIPRTARDRHHRQRFLSDLLG